jgi:hypothetical protein
MLPSPVCVEVSPATRLCRSDVVASTSCVLLLSADFRGPSGVSNSFEDPAVIKFVTAVLMFLFLRVLPSPLSDCDSVNTALGLAKSFFSTLRPFTSSGAAECPINHFYTAYYSNPKDVVVNCAYATDHIFRRHNTATR